jgi:hypothetical protein
VCVSYALAPIVTLIVWAREGLQGPKWVCNNSRRPDVVPNESDASVLVSGARLLTGLREAAGIAGLATHGC